MIRLASTSLRRALISLLSIFLALSGPAFGMPTVDAHGGIAQVPVSFHGLMLRALVDTGGYDYVDPASVGRLRLPTVSVRIRGKARRAVVTSSGDGLLVARSGAFPATFLDIPDATISLAYLRHRVATIDYQHETTSLVQPTGPSTLVPLLVRSGPAPDKVLPGQTFAALEASVAGERALWLLDTGAEARFVGRARAVQVSAVDARIAARWHQAHPDWPYRADAAVYASEDGATRVDAIAVPMRIGKLPARRVWCVVRNEDRSFDFLSRAFGKPVIGDAGATAFGPTRVTINVARERLEIR